MNYQDQSKEQNKYQNTKSSITIFFAGDVMTGRGIDQILPHPSKPDIYEPYIKSAVEYVELMEEHSGAIIKPVDYSYVWGAALDIFNKFKPDLKIVNLETSITTSEDNWKGKGINYRMNPANIKVLKVSGADYVSLANNHVIDWGYSGLKETLETIDSAGIKHSGAGMDKNHAEKPAIFDIPGKGRVIIFSLGSIDSGIPSSWQAKDDKPGVELVYSYDNNTVNMLSDRFRKLERPGDTTILSIHWGSNWGYKISNSQRNFAHAMIDKAGIDIFFGHSSHHPRGIEIYKGKLIIYGAGDLINDYEGISGYEDFRDDLSLMYFVSVNTANAKVTDIKMVPMQIRKFSLKKTGEKDSKWLYNNMKNESNKLGTEIKIDGDNIMYINPF